MAYTDIDNPSDYFSATLYTANGTARTIATGHQSDWVWLKRRDGTAGHRIADSVRGANKLLYSDSTTSEQSASNTITGFVSTGFTLGDDSGGYDVNTSSNTMVAWSWKAGGSASSNSSGSQNTTVSVNTTAGFSIVKWTGADSTGSLGHGLGAVPKMIIAKRLATRNWTVYHVAMGANKKLFLNTTAAETSIADFDATPTSSVINVGYTDDANGSGSDYIGYAFAEKQGYSKFGSYTGNGNADGTFVYLGFRPAWVMVKTTTDAGYNWVIYDNKRVGFNPDNDTLTANETRAEQTTGFGHIDMVSNGFKIRASTNDTNRSGNVFIYMAFAESPFTNSNGIPNNAR